MGSYFSGTRDSVTLALDFTDPPSFFPLKDREMGEKDSRVCVTLCGARVARIGCAENPIEISEKDLRGGRQLRPLWWLVPLELKLEVGIFQYKYSVGRDIPVQSM